MSYVEIKKLYFKNLTKLICYNWLMTKMIEHLYLINFQNATNSTSQTEHSA